MRKLVSLLAIAMLIGTPVTTLAKTYESMDVPTVIIVNEEEFKPTRIILYPEYKKTSEVKTPGNKLGKFNLIGLPGEEEINALIQKLNARKSYVGE